MFKSDDACVMHEFELDERQEFANKVRRTLGEGFSEETCGRIYDETLRMREANAKCAKMIYDRGCGAYFIYDAGKDESGLKSLFNQLRNTYGDNPKAVPYWLAEKAVVEAVELALSGFPVDFAQVSVFCDLFPWVGLDAEEVWEMVLESVAAANAEAERQALEVVAKASSKGMRRKAARV